MVIISQNFRLIFPQK